ncbi:unnamed protein product [Arabis nemorensis]|uniref:Uncharacterized protein n=1 Tax=Arabis nemorensis TaxID=586526 RepID=A0A565CW78_9BRAS|nr:unnamed protein product [Arabis nemorensis]
MGQLAVDHFKTILAPADHHNSPLVDSASSFKAAWQTVGPEVLQWVSNLFIHADLNNPHSGYRSFFNLRLPTEF